MKIAFMLGMLALLGACVGPPPSHALTVRHPELKCALIAFSNCGAFMPLADEPSEEEDAGDEDAGVE
jgi:hypothetical protein